MSGRDDIAHFANESASTSQLESAAFHGEDCVVTFDIGSALAISSQCGDHQIDNSAEDSAMPSLSYYGLAIEGSPCSSQPSEDQPLIGAFDNEMLSSSSTAGGESIRPSDMEEDADKISFLTSKKGKSLAVYQNQSYVREKLYKGKVFWKCQEYRSIKCSGRLTTIDNVVIKHTGCNHQSNVLKITGMRALQRIKAETVSLDSGVRLAVTSKVANLPGYVANALPSIGKIVKQIEHGKRVKRVHKKNPKAMKDLVLSPADFTLKSGETYLKYDNGDSDNRLVIFSSDKMLSFAARALKWQGDGTFKIVPLLFIQLYTLHFLFRKLTFPFVFCLMQHKTTESYKHMLNVVKQLLVGTSITFLVCDFEKAFMKAFTVSSTECKIQGSFFHFSQAVYKRINTSPLSKQYCSDPLYHFNLRMLSSLCFVPAKLVPSYFEHLLASPFYKEHASHLTQLIEYMFDVWIGRKTAEGRHKAQCDVEIWNCYNSIKTGSNITNNHIEGWHSGFSRKLDRRHPSVWLFADHVKIELGAQYSRLSQHARDKLIKYDNSNLLRRHASLKTAVQEFSSMPLLQYLNAITQILCA